MKLPRDLTGTELVKAQSALGYRITRQTVVNSSVRNEAANEESWSLAMQHEENGQVGQALKIYTLLSEAGDSIATYSIGRIYERGSVEHARDPAIAARWYRKAVFESDYPRAHLGLARLYYNGFIGQDDAAEAFSRHAFAGLRTDEADAFSMIGEAYQFGHLLEKNPTKAVQYYIEAANRGDVFSHRRLSAINFSQRKYVNGAIHYLKALVSALNRKYTNTNK